MLKIAGIKNPPNGGHDAAMTLLNRLYRETTGLPLPEIVRTDRGKPYFSGSDLHFSLSHTKNHAFCALSDRPVGIDAEEMGRKINLALAEKILSPSEYRQYAGAEDKPMALLTFWVLKEAGAKCTGEGLRGYPNKTNYVLNDPRVQVMDGCLVAVITEE